MRQIAILIAVGCATPDEAPDPGTLPQVTPPEETPADDTPPLAEPVECVGDNHELSIPVGSSDTILLLDNEFLYAAVQIDGGTQIWELDRTSENAAVLTSLYMGVKSGVISGSWLYLGGDEGLVRTDRSTGETEIWVSEPCTVVGENVTGLVVVTGDEIQILDRDTGSQLFSESLEDSAGSVIADDDYYFYSTRYAIRRGGFSGAGVVDFATQDGRVQLRESENSLFYATSGEIYRLPKDGGPGGLVADAFDIGDAEFAVAESTLIWASDQGLLFAENLSDPGLQSVQVDERGAWDDDDYLPRVVGDAEAAYWMAGPDVDHRSSDGDPLALFVACTDDVSP